MRKLLKRLAGPTRFELATSCVTGSEGQNLSACSGVAYESPDRLLIRVMIPKEA